MITIIDYGVGNIGSILNMMHYLDVPTNVQSEPMEILKAEKIILPGVGSFDHAMNRLEQSPGLIATLEDLIMQKKRNILGICLGMQLLTEKSEEGAHMGLGWVEATTKKFRSHNNIKIPHIGWCHVNILDYDSPLFKNFNDDVQFYFSHSYYVELQNQNEVLTETLYDINFASSFVKDNIFGVQFHPERSHKYGLQLLKNFSEL